MSLSRLSILVNIAKTIRGLLVPLILVIISVPVALYIFLSSDWAHKHIKTIAESELTKLMGVEVSINTLEFSPFNRILLQEVAIDDDNGENALKIKEIDARYEFWDLVFHQKFIIDYAFISDLDLRLYKPAENQPLNIAGIINRLKKEPSDGESVFKLRLNDVALQNCNMTYDVLSAPVTPGRFNPSHISVDSLSLSAHAPVVSNNDYRIFLRSLTLREQSGFRLDKLTARMHLTEDSVTVAGLKITLPNSYLSFEPISSKINGIKSLGEIATSESIDIQTRDNSHVFLPDLQAFVPIFGIFDFDISTSIDLSGTRDHIDIHRLTLSNPQNLISVDVRGAVDDFLDIDRINVHNMVVDGGANSRVINSLLSDKSLKLPEKTQKLLSNMGNTRIKGFADGDMRHGVMDMTIASSLASVSFNGSVSATNRPGRYDLKGSAKVDSLMLGLITGNPNLNKIKSDIEINGLLDKKSFIGHAVAAIDYFDFKGYTYRDIDAQIDITPSSMKGSINIDDANVKLNASGYWDKVDQNRDIAFNASIDRLRLDTLHITDRYPGYNLSGTVEGGGHGTSIDLCKAHLSVRDVVFRNREGEGIKLDKLEFDADNMNSHPQMTLTSDYINGAIEGEYKFSALVPEFKSIYEAILPALAPLKASEDESEPLKPETFNSFRFSFILNNCEELCQFFKLPVTLIDKGFLSGQFDAKNLDFALKLDMPWLKKGNDIVEGASLAVNLEGSNHEGGVYLTTMMPTKKGPMDISVTVEAEHGHLDSKVYWTIKRAIPINGAIDFTTILTRDSENNLVTQVNFNPGRITFGEDTWAIQQSMISYCNGRALINNFALISDTQSISVNGVAGPEDTDLITADLANIQLVDIFETLEIDNALIGGYATGTIQGSGVLGKTPVINCDALKVKSIGYNYCTLGDATVKLALEDEGKKFAFDAEVIGPLGNKSYIDGYILPATEELNLDIKADKVKVGFMKPFMAAFTSDVSGYASGKALLYGDFHNIDMKGDIYVDSLRIKIDFTNTYYYASDSIHIRPGIIDLKNITIADEYGHKALLNGWVAHEFFHNASFDFNVTHATNFLSYDVTERQSPDWYGRIFGNGSATVKGKPGVVDIGVNMSTAPNSTFTFVLSDAEEAGEYSFITFRDLTVRPNADSIRALDKRPELVRRLQQKKGGDDDSAPTAYNMDISIDVSPQVQVIIVMDPVGGDRIRANGTGHMRMTYGSISNDLRLYGTYTLERGSYNFTLQDIILKDFTIKDGSSITFLGDPYNAQLDINAYYQVNANLSDLDESFLQDKELNRTNVPVRALLMVKGDMLQPDITFDLEFPTLSQDVYRKVKSIVSTEDMMNRQIFYLLALNRFYTPEYMASTTKGNELFSVASSTLSSQLSNILGKLSDNWSIAPNLRSDRGDFTDLEVDLQLTSSLLNNRLLFNGNFGYRDKSLNTNQFIGDFDIEYLLDRKGEWRLKAYNRYNDQNYYLRTAQTTQGIGIVYRRDFDKTFKFLKHLMPRRNTVSDTTKVQMDTIIENMTITEKLLPDSLKHN